MSVIRRGDEELHHCDGRHRWTGGAGDPEVWRARLEAHLAEHRAGLDAVPSRQRWIPLQRPTGIPSGLDVNDGQVRKRKPANQDVNSG